MQRARRFVTSTASRSTPTNSGTKSRKRSRSSSSEDDSSPESKKTGNVANKKAKARAGKNNNASPKRPGRLLKPNSESLQHAIVVAPFSALKLNFQNKLINLYSLEKTKQLELKTRVAKQQNMSFEYDVLEYKPSGSDLKKDKKSKNKPQQRQGSSGYCQCDKTWTRSNQKNTNFKSQNLSKQAEVGLMQKLEILSEPDQSSFAYPSCASSPSYDSDEGSFFFREQNMKGSLAISATSFESCLQKFDECSSKEPKQKPRKTLERTKVGFASSHAGCSRNMIVPAEKKNSDSRIVDFMDREPKTRVISEDSNQHLQPLQRQSRPLVKKAENESVAGYYLRSLSTGKEKVFSTVNQKFLPECKTEPSKTRVDKIETGTQVDGSSEDEQNPEESNLNAEKQLLDVNVSFSAGSPEMQCPPEGGGASPDKEIAMNFLDVDRLDDSQESNFSRTPQDQEAEFIFGRRNASTRLGESCEFPFGLK